MAGLEQELQSVLSTREQYQGDYNVFISSLLPQCDQVIIECQVGLSHQSVMQHTSDNASDWKGGSTRWANLLPGTV